ncbi:acyl-CoA thioester hydrolase [Cokeromyces recurvatus]|uniref:acyl-CoA thioester hydrolase n=1 Tax=Cokeromyces recurvatus TaxID=90255 RepID=UPI002220A080|nr:acyl-CoA thioester hydrolase [Cokeromyces recurvatus]KAI7902889.1 acyl-CoA thioester hydrolase [Cokeromyces recurvatus]
MLRTIFFKPLKSNQAFKLIYKQRATLATSSRQIRGAQPSLIETDQYDPSFAKKVYTVRPVTFWMDKILEKENKRPLNIPSNQYQHQIINKTMMDSYMEEYLPFKSSPALLDEYITTGGKIRIGKILEDLDALAGAISYKHIDTFNPRAPPLTVVTASVDRMELLMPNTVEDLKLSGHVAYVGKSSMEVFVKVETIPKYDSNMVESSPFPPQNFLAEPTPNTVLFGRFTMVAIDSTTGKSVHINPLIAHNEREMRIFEYAQECKSRKKLIGESALDKVPPTDDERLTLHDLYMKNANQLSSPSAWIEDTKLKSVFLMQPQDRNIHNKVFGGYLMRRAYELAHATGSVFCKTPVHLLSLDEIVFKKPVPVGSLLNLSSKVIYSQDDSFQVSVTAEVTDMKTNTTDVTNTFHFSFTTQRKVVPQIFPKTYAEGMLYLEGKRRHEHGLQAKKQLLSLMSSS